MTASAKEVIAAGLYESWANYPACTTSDTWEVRCEKLPGSAAMFRQHATAILAALDAAGFVVVPREPTKAMVRAAWMAQPAGPCCDWDIEELYRAMFAEQEKP